MSMTAIRNDAMEAAKKAYNEMMGAAYQQEYDAMNEVLEVLKKTDKPLTARQIANKCKSDISCFEVAGNLIAMNAGHSRFDCGPGYGVDSLDVPKRHSMKIRNSGCHRIKVVELAEDGTILTDRVHTISLPTANTYQL